MGAGFINSVAGGGTILTFPALLLTGMPAITANATNSVAVLPGSLAGLWPYRHVLSRNRRRAWQLAVPSFVGGLAGSIVLLETPPVLFRAMAPWLILAACLLLAVQKPVARWVTARAPVESRSSVVLLWLSQLGISFYGGYFGAGIGILMLAAFGVFLPDDAQLGNALKIFLAIFMKGVAVVYFVIVGAADLPTAAVMAAAVAAGGFVGAHFALRLPPAAFRTAVIVLGSLSAVYLMAKG